MKKDLIDRISRSRVLADLKKMISIPSETGDESSLGNFIGDRLEDMGVEPELQPVEGARENVYGFHFFDREGPLLSLNGHLDTVPAGDGWTSNPYEPVEQDEKVYGLGSLDMKAGLAAMLEAFRLIVGSTVDLKGAISFSAVVDEEAYSLGAKALLSTEISESDAIITGEPFFGIEGSPVPLGITGKILYGISARGESAHGAAPEKGVNAIEEIASLLSCLDDLPVGSHPEFGAGNISTLKIEGGFEEYSVTVPDRCRAIINRLMVPGETVDGALEEMRNLIEGLSLEADFDVSSESPSYEPFVLSESEPIFEAFRSSYRETMGTDPVFGYLRNIMDANIFVNRADIPTLVFGPRGEGMHAPAEHVEIDSVMKTTEVYLETITNYLGRSNDKS